MSQRVESGIRIQKDDLCDSDSGLSDTLSDGRVTLDLRVILLGTAYEEVSESLSRRKVDPFKLLLLCSGLC